ncbi:MAG: PKD domain-containing protein [Thermoplasmata archaeon]|nr:PKD domain-containing protein [Thermoplasmata archaeon]
MDDRYRGMLYFVTWITYDGSTYKQSEFIKTGYRIPIALLVPNENPVADLLGPANGFIGMSLTYDASGSTDDRADDELDFDWDWGDGSTWDSLFVRKVVGHKYDEAGTYTVTVTVTDIDKAIDTASITVTIADPSIDFLWKEGPFSDSEVVKVLVDDVDDDGSEEIVVGGNYGAGEDEIGYGMISIFDLATRELEWNSSQIGAISDFELGNIDEDPAKEIVVGVVSDMTEEGAVSGFGYVFDGSNHSEEWRSGTIGGVVGVEIGNADSDPELELVFGINDEVTVNYGTFNFDLKGGIIVFGSDFSEEWRSNDYGAVDVFFVGDLDKDLYNEILIGSTTSMGFLGNTNDISVISWTGIDYETYYTQKDAHFNTIQVADLDRDFKMDIIVGESIDRWGDDPSGKVTVYDHKLSTKWTTQEIGQVHSLAIADVDGDIRPEVLAGVVTSVDGIPPGSVGYGGQLFIFDYEGNKEWDVEYIGKVHSIVTGDFKGDDGEEIAVVTVARETEDQSANCAIMVFDGSSHAQVSWITSLGNMLPFDLICVDGDGDGKDDLLFGSTEDDDGYITLYKLN